MRFIKFALAVVLCIPVSLFCACFSLGVGDLTEYNDRFPYVHAVKWDFSETNTDMSEFVGEEDAGDSEEEDDSEEDDSEEDGSEEDGSEEEDDSSGDDDSEEETEEEDDDLSTLTAVVDSEAYRAIAVEAGGSETYPSSTIGELNIYLYYSGETDVTLTYGIFVSNSLPQDDQSFYSMADFTDEQGDLYNDGDIVQPLSASDMLETGSVTLTNEGEDENDAEDENYGWSSIYVEFEQSITVTSGQYLIIVFFENNDYTVSITEVTEDDGTGTGNTVTKYEYAFTRYTDNDAAFSFDKVLLYVTDNE